MFCYYKEYEYIIYLQNTLWVAVWLIGSSQVYCCSCSHYKTLQAAKELSKECWHLQYLAKNVENLKSAVLGGDKDVFCAIENDDDDIKRFALSILAERFSLKSFM